MYEIRRYNVVQNSVCRIWLEPVPNQDDEYAIYQAWGNREDAEARRHWDNIDITHATSEDPIDFTIKDSNAFYTLVDVVFGASNGAGVSVFNQIFTQGEDGEWYQHGSTESRLLIPTADNALKWCTINVLMQNQ